MEAESRIFSKALLLFIGGMIGAGIFALPSVFQSLGFVRGSLLFWSVALLALVTHIFYIEIALHARQRMHFTGYVGLILGPWAERLAAVTYPLSVIGVNVVYLLLGGDFLFGLMKGWGFGWPVGVWQVVFWLIGVAVVYRGLKMIAKFESVATWFLVASLSLIIVLAWTRSAPLVVSGNSVRDLLGPFGIVLFTLSGLNLMSEVVDAVGRSRKLAFEVLVFGTLIVDWLSWMFGTALAAASRGLSVARPSDLLQTLPSGWFWLIPLFGFLAIITSYVLTSQDLRQTLRLDFHFSSSASWSLAFCIPLILLLVMKPNFLHGVSLIGSVFVGLNAFLVAVMAAKLHVRSFKPFAPLIRSAPYFFGVLYGTAIVHAVASAFTYKI